MQLQAVIAPPTTVGWDADQRAFGLVAEEVAAEEPRRGLLARFRASRPAEPAPAATFLPAEPSSVFVRLARFGNVTSTDAANLAGALEAAAARWPTPVVHVGSLEFGEDDGRAVTAQLEGETDALATIFREVNQVAKGQGFFLDRRNFRSELVVGRVEVPEGARVPTVVGSTVAHRGPDWRASGISLVRTSHSASGTKFEEVASFSLSTATEDVRGLRLA